MVDNRSTPQPGNFDGVRVIELSQVLAGPSCGKLMADMGAEVIKIEPPVSGDLARGLPHIKNGVSGYFMFRNGGKKSLCLDLQSPQGVAVFQDLVMVSDVVIEDQGDLARLGTSYEELREINPRIVVCSLTGYGLDGNTVDWPNSDPFFQAVTGCLYISGHEDGPYLPSWIPWVEFAAGTHGVGAIGAALFARDTTRRGEHIDIAMFDVAFTYHDFAIEEYLLSDGKVHRTRTGPMHSSLALGGVFTCQDGYLYVSAAKNWKGLMELIGRPELAEEPRYIAPHGLVKNKEEINGLVSAWIKDVAVEDARLLLEANEMIALPVLSPAEAADQPHMQVRELLVEVDHPRVGKVKLPNIPAKFSGTYARVRGREPFLGEHNEEILSDILGYSQQRIAELRENRILYAE